jgi:hypothetical protein
MLQILDCCVDDHIIICNLHASLTLMFRYKSAIPKLITLQIPQCTVNLFSCILLNNHHIKKQNVSNKNNSFVCGWVCVGGGGGACLCCTSHFQSN